LRLASATILLCIPKASGRNFVLSTDCTTTTTTKHNKEGYQLLHPETVLKFLLVFAFFRLPSVYLSLILKQQIRAESFNPNIQLENKRNQTFSKRGQKKSQEQRSRHQKLPNYCHIRFLIFLTFQQQKN
jgi:hypothetical protein